MKFIPAIFCLLLSSIAHASSDEPCTYVVHQSEVAGIRNAVAASETLLAGKGYNLSPEHAEFIINVDTEYCQPGGECGVQLEVLSNTPDGQTVYYYATKDFITWFKGAKARALLRELPSCEKFRAANAL